MGWLQSLIYGLVSGFTEFAPVSAPAHEVIMTHLFGADPHPLLRLLIHLGAAAALLFSCRTQVSRLHREKRLSRTPPGRRKRQPDSRCLADFKLMRTVTILLVLAFLLYPKASEFGSNLGITAVLLIVNGVILFVPQHLPCGNKDARSLSRLDGVVIGLCGALSVLPGISRVGAVSSSAMARGADRQYAVQLSLIVSIPVAAVLLIFDVVSVAAAGLSGVTFPLILQYLASAVMSYFGACCAILMIRFLSVKTGLSGFAYYSWGAALFSFILFLMT